MGTPSYSWRALLQCYPISNHVYMTVMGTGPALLPLRTQFLVTTLNWDALQSMQISWVSYKWLSVPKVMCKPTPNTNEETARTLNSIEMLSFRCKVSGILNRYLPLEEVYIISLEKSAGITNVGSMYDFPYRRAFICRPSRRGISHGFAIQPDLVGTKQNGPNIFPYFLL